MNKSEIQSNILDQLVEVQRAIKDSIATLQDELNDQADINKDLGR